MTLIVSPCCRCVPLACCCLQVATLAAADDAAASEDTQQPEAVARDREYALSLALQRLRLVSDRVEPWSRVAGIDDLWAALKVQSKFSNTHAIS